MMLGIKDTRQFQTLSLLSRAIFELAMEMKSIARDPDAAKKIELFSTVEKLRAARRTVDFYDGDPDVVIYKHQADFINSHGAQIDAEEATMWPANPVTGKRPSVKHWTLKNVQQRAKSLGAPFDRIYNVNYAQLSWMTHSGVVTPLNMTTEWVTIFVGVVYSIAAESYTQILETLVDEFKLAAANEHIKKKIRCNLDLGFTNTPAEGEAVMRKHGLWGVFEPPKPWVGETQ
jgi:hypothetical protein